MRQTQFWKPFDNQQDSVGSVRELLDAIGDLPEALREQDDLQHRINAMESDRKAFADAVSQLQVALGVAFDGKNLLVAAKALIRRHEEARQVQTKRQERDQALADLAIEREQLEGEIAIHSARKKELETCARVGWTA